MGATVRLGSTHAVNQVDGPSPLSNLRLEQMRFEKMEPSDFTKATLEFSYREREIGRCYLHTKKYTHTRRTYTCIYMITFYMYVYIYIILYM